MREHSRQEENDWVGKCGLLHRQVQHQTAGCITVEVDWVTNHEAAFQSINAPILCSCQKRESF